MIPSTDENPDTHSSSTTPAPLQGVRVLDLSRILAGPICTQILGDLGAEIIKIESPQGDDTRTWGPPFHQKQSAYFISANRNKYSVVLDLNKPQSRTVLHDLLGRSHALIHNFLEPSAEKFGLTPSSLKEQHPQVISCSITGFGNTGPWKNRPGYDLIIQALSGLMSITGHSTQQPTKVGFAITDVITGLYAAISILSGLNGQLNRISTRQNGTTYRQEGLHFDLSLFDCTTASLVNILQAFLITRNEPSPWGNAHPQIAPYESFITQDGILVLAIGNDAQWQRFCKAIQNNSWALDPLFATNPDRVHNRDQLIPQLQNTFLQRTTSDWIDLLTKHAIPHAPVQSLTELTQHPQFQARNMVTSSSTDSESDVPLINSPIRTNRTWQHDRKRLPPPSLGNDTERILTEICGYGQPQITTLRNLNVIA